MLAIDRRRFLQVTRIPRESSLTLRGSNSQADRDTASNTVVAFGGWSDGGKDVSHRDGRRTLAARLFDC